MSDPLTDDDDAGCRVMVDLDRRCGNPNTIVVFFRCSPSTEFFFSAPAAFKIECCDDCAKGFEYMGYLK